MEEKQHPVVLQMFIKLQQLCVLESKEALSCHTHDGHRDLLAVQRALFILHVSISANEMLKFYTPELSGERGYLAQRVSKEARKTNHKFTQC